MVATILGRKLGMTQVWSEDDQLVPVTVIEAGPCVVSQVKTDKRTATRPRRSRLASSKPNKVNKPHRGPLRQGGRRPAQALVEVRLDGDDKVKVGDEFTVEHLRGRVLRSTSPARARARASPAR